MYIQVKCVIIFINIVCYVCITVLTLIAWTFWSMVYINHNAVVSLLLELMPCIIFCNAIVRCSYFYIIYYYCNKYCTLMYNYRLITAYLLLRVNLDKIMHARWDFDASSARTRRVSALDKHQNWSPSALFCLNSRAQSKYAVVNLIHTRRKQTFLSFIM